MTLQQLFIQTNLAFRGSDDDAPVINTTDYTLWLGTANRKLNEWSGDGKHTWSSLFEIRDLGTVSVGVQTLDLDSDILLPADSLIVTTLTGNDIEYSIVKPQERGRDRRTVYISGHDPQQLTFSDVIIATDPIVGGKIKLSGYFVPPDLVSPNDVVACDDPYWLVYATAAELAFNDLTYQSKYPELNAKANSLYTGMVSNNDRGTGRNPRRARYAIDRIVDTRGGR